MAGNSVAIITARGGSKRIPRKNVRHFCGRPIIEYSIEVALGSGCFDLVMVSTDDQEIADVARAAGAEVPFPRSASSADDYATTADVLEEVLREFDLQQMEFEFACCIYPTAPFLTADVLRLGKALLVENTQVPGVIPVSRFAFPIQRALRISSADGRVSFFRPEYALTRSQDLEPAFHDAGQFYWLRVESFLESHKIIGPGFRAIELPDWAVQDIDEERDWRIAESKFRMLDGEFPSD